MADPAVIETVRALNGSLEHDVAVRFLQTHQRWPSSSVPAKFTPEELLARGLIRWIVEATWRSTSCLCGGEQLHDRFWKRHSLSEIALRFSSHTERLLQWLMIEESDRTRSPFGIARSSEPPTIADHLVRGMAMDHLRHSPISRALALPQAGFSFPCNFWIVPEDVAEDAWPAHDELLTLLAAEHAWGLEVLAAPFAGAFLRMERSKWSSIDASTIVDQARTQAAAIKSWVEPALQGQRHDLLVPLLRALPSAVAWAEQRGWGMASQLKRDPNCDHRLIFAAWMTTGRLLVRLSDATERCRAIGYFDEHYAASQLWLLAWETSGGSELLSRFRKLERTLADSFGPAPTSTEELP